jgi:hypothetical protein
MSSGCAGRATVQRQDPEPLPSLLGASGEDFWFVRRPRWTSGSGVVWAAGRCAWGTEPCAGGADVRDGDIEDIWEEAQPARRRVSRTERIMVGSWFRIGSLYAVRHRHVVQFPDSLGALAGASPEKNPRSGHLPCLAANSLVCKRD